MKMPAMTRSGTHCPNVLTVCYFKTSSGGIPAPWSRLARFVAGARGCEEALAKMTLTLPSLLAVSCSAPHNRMKERVKGQNVCPESRIFTD